MRFILVDRIVELVPGERIVAEKDVKPEEDYFRDHFPGFPVVPGVLLTEMMAQAAGKCLDAEKLPRGKAMLARIRSASFRQWVCPGSLVEIHAIVGANQAKMATAACHVEVSGKKVAEADLLFSFLPMGNLQTEYRDEILEEFLSRALD